MSKLNLWALLLAPTISYFCITSVPPEASEPFLWINHPRQRPS